MPPHLSTLPDELVFIIAECLDCPSEVYALLRCARKFYHLNTLLYKMDAESQENSALRWAARHGIEATATNALCALSPSELPHGALSIAAYYGHENIIALLCKHGVDLDERTNWESNVINAVQGGTPLTLAVMRGNLSVAQLLLRHGASIDGKGRMDRTALCEAAAADHLSVVQMLLCHGASLEPRDHLGRTALGTAALYGHLSVMQTLVDAGAEINVTDSEWAATPLHLAARMGRTEAVKLLLEVGADFTIKTRLGSDPLTTAVGSEYEDIVRCLIDRGATPHRLTLRRAVAIGRPEIVQLVLNAMKCHHATEFETNIPLIALAAASAGLVEVLEDLISKGLKLNSVSTDEGKSPLAWAIKHKRVDTVRLLLSHGANPKEDWLANGDGGFRRSLSHPLYLAIKEGCEEIVSLLLETGSELEIGEDSLKQASNHEGVFKLLIDNNAHLDKLHGLFLDAIIEGKANVVQIILDKKLSRKESVIPLLEHIPMDILALSNQETMSKLLEYGLRSDRASR
ncbi:ankyrin repeat-containing domain protein [Aspergillus carlsbadensis]|nr:ankyrin repeat-containing domain protein [Aspergillus carlsbadensis]